MQIELLPQDIDKIIKETILKSALGKNLEATIDKTISEAINIYNSPVKTLVNEVVRELIKEQLAKPEYRQAITDAIIKRITPETIDSILNYGIQKLHDHVRNYD